MYVIVWKYEVSPSQDESFKSAYGSAGDWATLFSRGSGYIGTELIAVGPSDYITIDRWQSIEDFERFLTGNRADYQDLDEACAVFTVKEELIGQGLADVL